MQNGNPNWSVQLPPKDPTAIQLQGVSNSVPPGAYHVRVLGSEMLASKNGKAPNVYFECVILDGDLKGSKIRVRSSTNFAAEFIYNQWATLFVATGAIQHPSQLAQGIASGPQVINGREAFVHVRLSTKSSENDDDEETPGVRKSNTDRLWITKESYLAEIGGGAAPGGQAGQGGQGQQGFTPPPVQQQYAPPAQQFAPQGQPGLGYNAPPPQYQQQQYQQPPQATPNGAFGAPQFASPPPGNVGQLAQAFGAQPAR